MADDHIGDSEDLERACEWQGPRGELTKALLSCGRGGRGAGFVELREHGQIYVHDLDDHAPQNVKARLQRAREERKKKETNIGVMQTDIGVGETPLIHSHIHTDKHTNIVGTCRKSVETDTEAQKYNQSPTSSLLEEEIPEKEKPVEVQTELYAFMSEHLNITIEQEATLQRLFPLLDLAVIRDQYPRLAEYRANQKPQNRAKSIDLFLKRNIGRTNNFMLKGKQSAGKLPTELKEIE
jgi:hypothetical protein